MTDSIPIGGGLSPRKLCMLVMLAHANGCRRRILLAALLGLD
jgi:hypothetical protein